MQIVSLGVVLHLPLYIIAPPWLLCLSPLSCFTTLHALLMFFSSLIFSRCLRHVALLASAVLSFSSPHKATHSPLLRLKSLHALLLLLLRFLISEVIHGITSFLSTFTGQTSAAVSFIIRVNFFSFQSMFSSSSSRNAPILSSISCLYLLQSSFFRFSSTALIFLFTLTPVFHSTRIGRWSDDRSSTTIHSSLSLSSTLATVTSGTDLPVAPSTSRLS